jgi:hypothetical protein
VVVVLAAVKSILDIAGTRRYMVLSFVLFHFLALLIFEEFSRIKSDKNVDVRVHLFDCSSLSAWFLYLSCGPDFCVYFEHCNLRHEIDTC